MSDAFYGVGDVYIDRLTDAGESTGLRFAGDADLFEIQAESELKEMISKGKNTHGQVIASVNIAKPSKMKIKLNQINAKVLAMAFLGEDSVVTQATGTIADESIVAKLDGFIDLVGKSISGVSITNSAKDTTYTEGDDYTVDLEKGWVKVLSDGTITEGQEILVNYTQAEVKFNKIVGSTKPKITARLYLDGKNEATQEKVTVDCYQVQLKPTSAVNFLAEDFSSLELEGTMITPTGRNQPFHIEQIVR